MTTNIQTIEYTRRFILGDLTTPITINIWRNNATGWLSATASHEIKTPMQNSPDVPQPGGHHQGSEEEAFDSVVDLYHAEYMTAIEADNEPAESWLVPVR